MTQRDFWTWAGEKRQPTQKKEVRGGGRLFLSELPTDLGIALPEIQGLHAALEARLGAVDLVLTDNRRRMISAKKKGRRQKVRLHHMFVGCEDRIVDALCRLVQGGEGGAAARRCLKEYIDGNRDAISQEVDPDKLVARGEYHDLQAMLDKWRLLLDAEGLEDVAITWGRYGRGSRTIRFGSYDFDQRLIRMHPALDKAWVPDYFVEFIVYHELLHGLFPPEEKESRRVVHTEEFRMMEERFPRYDEAIRWERKNLFRFLER